MSDVFERAIDQWRASGARVRTPASESEIEETFASLEFPLTDEVRDWDLLADGFEDIDEKSCLWWWPPERIRDANQHSRRDPGYLWFADHLICSSIYCPGPSAGKASSVWIDEADPWMRSPPQGPLGPLTSIWQRPVFRIRYGAESDTIPAETPRFEKKADCVALFVEKLLASPDDADPYIIS